MAYMLLFFFSPCHSLILDVSDASWNDYFTEAELHEIKTANPKSLPSLPTDLQEYLNSIIQLKSIDAAYRELSKQFISPIENSSLEWAQSSAYDYWKLFIFNFFPLNH
jgi:hypothetical protein